MNTRYVFRFHLAIALFILVLMCFSFLRAAAQHVSHRDEPVNTQVALVARNATEETKIIIRPGQRIRYKSSKDGWSKRTVVLSVDSTTVALDIEGRITKIPIKDFVAIRVMKSSRKVAGGVVLMLGGVFTIIGSARIQSEARDSYVDMPEALVASLYTLGAAEILAGIVLMTNKQLRIGNEWTLTAEKVRMQ